MKSWRSGTLSVFFTLGLLLSCSRTADVYLQRGIKLYEAGKYADAAIQFRRALQKDPKSAEACYQLGLAEMQSGKSREAYAAIARAVELAPNHTEAVVKLADMNLAAYIVDPQHQARLYEAVNKLADGLLARDPQSFHGLRLKGSLALLDRKPELAIAAFERANNVKPFDRELVHVYVQALFQVNQAARGEQLAMELISREKNFGPMYDVLYRHYLESKRAADAENIAKLRVTNNPTQDVALVQLAEHYWRFGKSDEAVSTIQRLLDQPKVFPKAYLLAGEFYARKGRWQEAIQQFEAGSRQEPKESPKYRKRIAGVYLAMGKRDEALRTLDDILKEQPADTEARRMRAELLLGSGTLANAAAAVQEYEALVKNNPDDVGLRFELSRAHLARSDPEAARVQLQEVVRRSPGSVPARLLLAATNLRQGRLDAAQNEINAVLSADPNNASAKLLRSAVFMNQGRLDESRQELASLARRFPNSPAVKLQQGLLALMGKQYQEAERIFTRLRQTGTGDLRAGLGLAEMYAAQQQFDHAIQLLKEELSHSPESSTMRRLLASTAMQGGKYDIAIEQYRHMLASDPSSMDLYMRLGEVYQTKGELNTALDQYALAAKVAPNNPLPPLFLGMASAKAGRPEEAIQHYRQSLKLQPDNTIAMNNLALLLADHGGDLDEALRLAQRATQRASKQQLEFADTLGWVYLKKGLHDSASQVFSNLVRQQPNNPAYRFHLGKTLMEKGDKEGARKELEGALANRPSSDDESKIRELLRMIG